MRLPIILPAFHQAKSPYASPNASRPIAPGRPTKAADAAAKTTISAANATTTSAVRLRRSTDARVSDAPVVNLAVHSIAAVVAEMSGDPDKALQELRLAGLDRVPGAIGTATRRFLIHCLLLTGQADEAAEVAQRLLETSNTTIVRYMPAFARWMAGDPPPQRLAISVLGPLRVAFDGIEVPASALRRVRVRALLSLLVVHRTLSRDRAIDLLWPRLGAVDGARNLRVTLMYLRQLIEPQRPVGQAPFHLRTDRATVSLHSSAHLTVDLWELQRLAREATVSREQGDPDRTIELLAAATSMWRGEPLLDLESTLDQEAEVEHTRLLYLDSRLELGERRLARGRPAEASIDAERALTLDPYSQRIHRLAIAAALHGHDRARTSIVVERALERLGELGVEPEPATQILLRQAC